MKFTVVIFLFILATPTNQWCIGNFCYKPSVRIPPEIESTPTVSPIPNPERSEIQVTTKKPETPQIYWEQIIQSMALIIAIIIIAIFTIILVELCYPKPKTTQNRSSNIKLEIFIRGPQQFENLIITQTSGKSNILIEFGCYLENNVTHHDEFTIILLM